MYIQPDTFPAATSMLAIEKTKMAKDILDKKFITASIASSALWFL